MLLRVATKKLVLSRMERLGGNMDLERATLKATTPLKERATIIINGCHNLAAKSPEKTSQK